MPVEILHLAFASFPADPRVRREVAALRDTVRGVAVVALRETNQRAVERRDGVVIIRVPGHKSRGGFLSYLTEYAAFVWRCRRLVARHRALARARVVHVHTLPDFLLWAALPAQRRGAKLVFDMHEIFPEFVAAKFPGPLGGLAAWLARRIERWARRRADLTITVNRPIDELLATRPVGGSKPERRLVLHNTADPADYGDTPAAARRGGGVPPPPLAGMPRSSLPNKALDSVPLGTPLLAAGLPIYLRYFGEALLWYSPPGEPDAPPRATGTFAPAPAAERARRA